MRRHQGGRLRRARVAAGYRSAREAALENGWPESTYRAHESGTRTIGQDDAERYARRYRAAGVPITAQEILFGSGDDELPDAPRNPQVVAIMGRIGAGAAIDPELEQIPPEGLYEVSLPFPTDAGMIAFEVAGESMLPKYEPGDVIVVWAQQRRDTENYVGRLAAVRTADGRRFLKTILRGSRRGLYRLESFNARPIEDVIIEWVGEIYVIVPSEQVRHAEQQRRVRAAAGVRRA